MSRRLIVMRHAKSDWANPNLSDHDRPLNDRGSRTAPLMGKYLAENHVIPKVVIASTAVRVRETLAFMLAEWPHEPEVFFEQSLYLASVETLRSHIRGLHNDWHEVLIVGHNPGLTDLVSRLAGQPLEMPTAAVAVFASDEKSWSDALAAKNWALAAHWLPRNLFS
jgi:phosphohistidine phosphatase